MQFKLPSNKSIPELGLFGRCDDRVSHRTPYALFSYVHNEAFLQLLHHLRTFHRKFLARIVVHNKNAPVPIILRPLKYVKYS